MLKTYKLIITGQVQGVGFRPYVYVLAKEFNIKGTVSNNEEGVIIIASGTEEEVHSFYQKLIEHPPKVARINSHHFQDIELRQFDEFQIIPSKKSGKLNLQLTPDFAICKDCKNDISNRENRRFHYPFTTCVNCGPRWAITNTFPFERDHTSISEFEMCEQCINEYANPEDRRFHSQTNSCSVCGIGYKLVDNNEKEMQVTRNQIFSKMAELLSEGEIIAIKNTGGYLLCCDATSEETVESLRKKKNRPDKPFAVMYPSLELLEQGLRLSQQQKKLLCSPERPIVIIPMKDYKGDVAGKAVAPGLSQLGVMLPYSGIMQLLANELDRPIVATSGNLHGSPILSDEKESTVILRDVADYFFNHNLRIINPQDDSVVKISERSGIPVMFRRSRGYAPNLFKRTESTTERVMALGGNLKSTIAFIPNDYLYMSEYLGVLDHYDVYRRFVDTVTKFIRLFEQEPDVILVDKHPAYQSTLYGIELAKENEVDHYKVQHHKAHFAAVMGEYNLFDHSEPILGVVWDGTGYGDDGAIWGGEFFTFENKTMDRLSHFEYFDWLAGDKMAKEPRLSLLSITSSEDIPEIAHKFSEQEITIYSSVKEENNLKTSSVGRLFDAVASLLDICDLNSYEGEAAILLENYVSNYNLDECMTYAPEMEGTIISTRAIWNNLYSDFRSGTSRERIIVNFLYTLASLVKDVATARNIKNIAFSGGVFQNTILVDMINDIVGSGHKLYFHRELSPNDENISFGQLMYYIHCTKNTTNS
ncbi:MAG: carbamoyltransferase HypF [Bacteroidia bacterium]|nr:carbamoyltransferase HypF [Bacteroidia bacterium]MBT8274974.1 carbamoyltransferase HypF [Bacteroidia bacterium]NNF30096.1 carbamoyltransferase HypF [Flavobacteriaceae bacterium]NNK55541.1 carbamoyltransferase HypF [Flavobacteriaceae bacterium]NNM08098.1 carbamoyltransferase HypF [Flavobacteriaceae bacterium]